MKTIWLAAALVLGVAAQDSPSPSPEPVPADCDLKQVEPTRYCPKCEWIDPDLNDDQKCSLCKQEVVVADVCVKPSHACNRCGRLQAAPGKCCGQAMVYQVVK